MFARAEPEHIDAVARCVGQPARIGGPRSRRDALAAKSCWPLLFATWAWLAADPASASCWEAAGRQHSVDPLLLQAIAWKESRGWTHAVGPKLRDGHRALGLMQINSIHLPVLARSGITRDQLFDACTSQTVGAWVLAECIARFGSTWKSVGCYYTGPASRNLKAQADYVADVRRYYDGYRRATAARAPSRVSTTEPTAASHRVQPPLAHPEP